MSVTPPGSPQDRFIFPERAYSSKEVKFGNEEQMELKHKVNETVGKSGLDILGNMLAELREGTMGVDMWMGETVTGGLVIRQYEWQGVGVSVTPRSQSLPSLTWLTYLQIR